MGVWVWPLVHAVVPGLGKPWAAASSAGRRIVVDLRDRDELELSVSARFVEFASEAPVDDVELVELEDPLDGVDEVPGPPEAERPVDAEAGLDELPPAGAQAA